MINLRRQFRRRCSPFRTRLDVAFRQCFVDVVDDNVKARALQTRRNMSAQIAEAYVTVFHTFTGWLVISRCSFVPV